MIVKWSVCQRMHLCLTLKLTYCAKVLFSDHFPAAFSVSLTTLRNNADETWDMFFNILYTVEQQEYFFWGGWIFVSWIGADVWAHCSYHETAKTCSCPQFFKIRTFLKSSAQSPGCSFISPTWSTCYWTSHKICHKKGMRVSSEPFLDFIPPCHEEKDWLSTDRFFSTS